MRGPDAMSRNPASVASIDSYRETMKVLCQTTTSASATDDDRNPDIDSEVNAISAINMVPNNWPCPTHHARSDLSTWIRGYWLLVKAKNHPGWLPNSPWKPTCQSTTILGSQESPITLEWYHNARQTPCNTQEPPLSDTSSPSFRPSRLYCTGMQARVNDCIYWPGINKDIHRVRDCCKTCISHSHSQPKEPIIQSPPPPLVITSLLQVTTIWQSSINVAVGTVCTILEPMKLPVPPWYPLVAPSSLTMAFWKNSVQIEDLS